MKFYKITSVWREFTKIIRRIAKVHFVILDLINME